MGHHQRDAPAPNRDPDPVAVGQAQLMGTKRLERNGVRRSQRRARPQTRCRFVIDGHRIRRSAHWWDKQSSPTQGRPSRTPAWGRMGMAGTPTPPTSRGEPDPAAARALYQRHAETYDTQTDWAGSDRAKAVSLLELRPGDTVVDVGCGTGLCFAAILEEIGPSGRRT